MTDKFLRLPDVIAISGLRKSTIYELIKKREFPAPIHIRKKAAVWPEGCIRQWQADIIARETKKPAGKSAKA